MISVASKLKIPTPPFGSPISRVDGPAKVTGQAKYTAEFRAEGLLHGFVVSSGIAVGTVTALDTTAATAVPGVVKIYTHENRPRTAYLNRRWADEDSPPGEHFRPLYDNRIQFSGQPIALVVASSLEAARYAASLLKISYQKDGHQTNLQKHAKEAMEPKQGKTGWEPPPKPWGDPEGAFAHAEVKIDAEYHCPVEHHNPMEMHAAIAIPQPDGTLEVYDKTQGVQNSQSWVAGVFGLSPGSVRVRSPFVGGAFGSGLRPQYQLFLAVMAALDLRKPVKVVLTRQQMFTFGHRPETLLRVKLGAARDGRLTALLYDCIQETSRFEEYTENIVNWAATLYRCDNVRLGHKVLPLDNYTPLDMRAPGAVWGLYGLASAMDELAVKLGMDPVALRLKNYTDTDPLLDDKPFSSKALRECYELGARRFGWERRNPTPRSMRDGKHLIGWGHATGIWDAQSGQAGAKATLTRDGRLEVASATADIGTGTYTIMTQVAAETMGLPIESVTFKLGDSSLPRSPLEGGSWTAATVGPAVKAVCDRLRSRLLKSAARITRSPFAGASLEDVLFQEGRIILKSDPAASMSFGEAMHGEGVDRMEEVVENYPNPIEARKYSKHTHSAIFAEVRVDEDLGTIGVSRVVTVVAAGRIINPKTARSQVLGGIVWGIGSALQEETFLDHDLGRFMNHDFAEYHIPVCADIGSIDVIFAPEEDPHVNALGVKGVGEIGVIGVAAAIANAVHHATGKRIRSLPITLDKLLGAPDPS